MILGISAEAIKESIFDPFEELLQQASEISRPEDAGEAVLEQFSNWLQDMICSLLEEGLDGVKIRPKQYVPQTPRRMILLNGGQRQNRFRYNMADIRDHARADQQEFGHVWCIPIVQGMGGRLRGFLHSAQSKLLVYDAGII
jgi:hypothetical protein